MASASMDFSPEDRATGRMSTSMPDGIVEDEVVLFAIPKKGRLFQHVSKLLDGAGLDAKRPDRLDVATCKDLPIKLVFLPAADIPSYVLEGNVDLGITGSDMLEEAVLEAKAQQENTTPIEVKMKLGFGKCKLCLQAPKAVASKGPTQFLGKRIVTSFPHLTKRYFSSLDEKAGTTIKVVSGSVEAACGLGLADAVVDLVETGTTMKAAGLEVVEEIMETEALLIHQVKDPSSPRMSKLKQDTISLIEERLLGYMTACRHVMVVYNCHEDNLQRCCQITPGRRSPTMTKLHEEKWFSVSALVEKSKSNNVMDELRKAGAMDVLCFSLANTRM